MRRYFVVLFFATLLFSCGKAGSDVETASTAISKGVRVTDDFIDQTTVSVAVFTEQAAASNLIFQHYSGASGAYWMPEILGSGAAVLDYDDDGDMDVYLVQGTDLDHRKKRFPLPSNQAKGPRLFANQLHPSGKLTFLDVTMQANLVDGFYGMGVAASDYDNDGDVDLYVVGYKQNRLYRNNGGVFERVDDESDGESPYWGSSASFCDVNNDQWPDLYVANYIYFEPEQKKICRDSLSQEDYCSPDSYKGVPDVLFINQRDGKFTQANKKWGINRASGTGLGVLCRDLNQDGYNDLYVANDSMANLLWINEQGKRFVNAADEQGAAININGLTEGSMGVTAGDIDFDQDDDLFMTHWNNETNTLYRNDGDIGFMDVTTGVNLAASSLARTGFGTDFIDYDNDGDLDIFIANGAVQRYVDKNGKLSNNYGQGNQLLRNDDGKRFTDMSSAAGPGMSLIETGRGAAFGDMDNDGDTDVVVTNKDGSVRLYINNIGHASNWLGLKLIGAQSRRDAQGAIVSIQLQNGRTLRRVVRWDGSYQSAHDPRIILGLGRQTRPPDVHILWPSGHEQVITELMLNRYHVVIEDNR